MVWNNKYEWYVLFHSKCVATCWQTLFAITVLDGREKKILEKVVFFFLQVPHADSVEVTGLKKVSPKSAAKRLSNVILLARALEKH